MIQTQLVAVVPWAATTKLQILLLWLSLSLLHPFAILFSKKGLFNLHVLAHCSKSRLKWRLAAGFRARSPLIEPFSWKGVHHFQPEGWWRRLFELSFLTARCWGHRPFLPCLLSIYLFLPVFMFIPLRFVFYCPNALVLCCYGHAESFGH